jgi:hypothetical protein
MVKIVHDDYALVLRTLVLHSRDPTMPALLRIMRRRPLKLQWILSLIYPSGISYVLSHLVPRHRLSLH